MNTIFSDLRPALFGLVLIAFAGGLTATASADDWAAPRPRLFISENGRHGFKVLPKNTGGVLFSLDDDGKEQVAWNKQLVNVPDKVFVADDGKHVVTIDTYADLGREHSLVGYGAKGKVLGDYRLEELLSEQEIRDRVIETAPNRWWASEASFKYRNRGQEAKYFQIALKVGKGHHR